MNKFSIFSIIFFLFSFLPWCIQGSFLSADTHIPYGDVSGTWTIEGSPYIIDGHINVPVDSTLVIEPGVNVIFSDWYYFRVYGRLLAEGTESDTIRFTVNDTINDFASLIFSDTDISLQDSSKVRYFEIDHGYITFSSSSSAVVKNGIVTNGYGIGFNNSSPTIVDVTINNNISEGYGGGISCTNSSNPSLINVTISGNSATWGGGISCRFNSNPSLENVNIINNSAIAAGGGILCEESSPSLNNVIILENEGSGICCTDESSPTLNNVIINNNNGGFSCFNSSPILTDVIISGNYAIYGGGIYCEGYEEDSCNPILNNVTITGNEAEYLGGGIYSYFSDIIVVNSLITGNIAGGGGGGIGCFYESNMSLTNVTISENISGDGFGGGIYSEYGSNIQLENCIMWNDIPNEVVILTGSFVSANYCDIEGGAIGTGNIDDDPLFSDDEFHLSEDSPCIDAGNPDSLYYDIEDSYNPGYALYPAMGTIINDMGTYGGHGYYEPPVSVDEELITEKPVIKLNNYPNPFNPETTISFSILEDSKVNLSIYNIKGQLIDEITVSNQQTEVSWNAEGLASGIYIYKLNLANSPVKKMLLLK
jgi:predicted outer membrane repeat protein